MYVYVYAVCMFVCSVLYVYVLYVQDGGMKPDREARLQKLVGKSI